MNGSCGTARIPACSNFPWYAPFTTWCSVTSTAIRERPAFGAGLAVFLTGLVCFGYKGAFFWKMTAGMGDVVIAPVYQALRQRGVDFEFFHRLDALHLDDSRLAIEAITMGRQVRLADGVDHYEPLTTVRGFRSSPAHRSEQWQTQIDSGVRLAVPGNAFGLNARRRDAGTAARRRLRPRRAGRLAGHAPDRRQGTDRGSPRLARNDNTHPHRRHAGVPDLAAAGRADAGLARAGRDDSAYLRPFETWASMPQTLWAEDWPDDDRPGTVAYFCGSLETRRGRRPMDPARTMRDCETASGTPGSRPVHRSPRWPLLLPNAVTEDGFAWHLLSGVNGERGDSALATQHVSVNIDPSDRYVQSVPDPNEYRLRPDESGYDNLISGGRLDGLRYERRLHRGGGDVGAAGGERVARSQSISPYSRLLDMP